MRDLACDTTLILRHAACGQLAGSRFGYEAAEAFSTLGLMGLTKTCGWCDFFTPCAIGKMRFTERMEGHCIGAFAEGHHHPGPVPARPCGVCIRRSATSRLMCSGAAVRRANS